ncbi:MAG: flgH [Anaerosporomusa subterranea]|nr:flgH [Anaerosporomusa subterranea]
MTIRILVLLMVALITFTPVSDAASLWSDSGSLFSDRKAHAVGDIITIIISEVSSAKRSGDTSNGKSSNTNLADGTGKLDFIPALGATYSDQFKASGSISNTNIVSGRITVQVTEVKPNGYLVVSGKQTIKQGSDEQRITISGIVRPDDVTADNTVLSNYVSNAELKIDGKGPLSSKQRQGILSSLFNFLF